LCCQHCFAERHAATGDLPLVILEKILREGRACSIDHLAFTGGEPTIHRQFAEIIARVCEAGYTFSFVSNGTTFLHLYPLLLRHRQWLTGITFSLDGAREVTHDGQRGAGSYRRMMRAASLCVIKDLPFMLNIVLTTQNRHEVSAMVALASRLESRGLRFVT
jgi:Predicted Fe-S oxidoreductases